MKPTGFLRDKLFFIIIIIVIAGMGSWILLAFHLPATALLLFNAVYLAGSLAALLYEYFTKRAYYRECLSLLEELDPKYYIAEILQPPDFAEGKILAEALGAAGKSMNDAIAAERKANREYREYVELWVHEIKTPISAIKLICENNRYEEIARQAGAIEQYVEQALFYARAGSVENDYLIRKVDLKPLISGLLKEKAASFIAKGIGARLEAEGEVYADPKWLAFILGQLTDNAIKYGAKTISFFYQDGTLTVRDDGAGIPAQDLPRVFERGFTGENGRGSAKSTGMGLYLCKELCGKLGLSISAASGQGQGTGISITFPENPYVTEL